MMKSFFVMLLIVMVCFIGSAAPPGDSVNKLVVDTTAATLNNVITPATLKPFDLANWFIDFATLVAIIPIIVELFKKFVIQLKLTSAYTQTIAIILGLIITMIGWVLNLGFLNGLDWYSALLYGLFASLAANGVFDTGIINMMINLIPKKKTSGW